MMKQFIFLIAFLISLSSYAKDITINLPPNFTENDLKKGIEKAAKEIEKEEEKRFIIPSKKVGAIFLDNLMRENYKAAQKFSYADESKDKNNNKIVRYALTEDSLKSLAKTYKKNGMYLQNEFVSAKKIEAPKDFPEGNYVELEFKLLFHNKSQTKVKMLTHIDKYGIVKVIKIPVE